MRRPGARETSRGVRPSPADDWVYLPPSLDPASRAACAQGDATFGQQAVRFAADVRHRLGPTTGTGGVFPCSLVVGGKRETLSRCPARAVHFQ